MATEQPQPQPNPNPKPEPEPVPSKQAPLPTGPATSGPTPAPVLDEAGHPVRARLWTSVGISRHFGVLLVLATIVLLVYSNTFNAGFTFDSRFLILEDSRIQEASKDNLKLILTEDYWWPKSVSGLYRPITKLSFLLNYAIFENGTSPAGYRWMNVVLHWVNAVLVYFVVLMLMRNMWPGFFVAAIFAVHPVATEAVSNIIGRSELLAAAAVLGALLLHARGAVAPGWRKIPWLIGLAVVTALGVFSNEAALMIAGLVIVYDLIFRLESKHRNRLVNLVLNVWGFFWKGYLALVPPLAGWFYVRREVFERLRPPELPWVQNPLVMEGVDTWEQKLTAIKVIGKYLWLLIWPARLSPDYSYNQVPVVDFGFSSWEDWKAIIALVMICLALLIALRECRRNRPLSYLILFFFIALVPTSNLLFPLRHIMAERFLYLPLVGFAGCLVIAVYGICRRLVLRLELSAWIVPIWLQIAARSVLMVILLALGARAFARNLDWQDEITLWSAAVKTAPNSHNAHKSLAFALYEEDPTAENQKLDQIIEEAEQARAITDQTEVVLLHMGAYYRLKGDSLAQQSPDGNLITTPASRKWYRQSVDVLKAAVVLDRASNQENLEKQRARGRAPEEIRDIGNHEIYWNLGLSEMRLGEYDEAIDAYEYMRHLSPGSPDAYLSIASAQLLDNRLESATIALVQALLLDNSRQETIRLLVDIYRQTDKQGCAIVFSAGEPKLNVDCAQVRSDICRAYGGLAEVFVAAKQLGLAAEIRDTAVREYRCNKTAFDRLLPSPKIDLDLAP